MDEEAAITRIGELIAELTPALGPPLDSEGELSSLGEVPDSIRPVEWALVVQYVDMRDGEAYRRLICPSTQLESHVIGLLSAALQDF